MEKSRWKENFLTKIHKTGGVKNWVLSRNLLGLCEETFVPLFSLLSQVPGLEIVDNAHYIGKAFLFRTAEAIYSFHHLLAVLFLFNEPFEIDLHDDQRVVNQSLIHKKLRIRLNL